MYGKFTVGKSNVMHIGRSHLKYPYTLLGLNFNTTTQGKDGCNGRQLRWNLCSLCISSQKIPTENIVSLNFVKHIQRRAKLMQMVRSLKKFLNEEKLEKSGLQCCQFSWFLALLLKSMLWEHEKRNSFFYIYFIFIYKRKSYVFHIPEA